MCPPFLSRRAAVLALLVWCPVAVAQAPVARVLEPLQEPPPGVPPPLDGGPAQSPRSPPAPEPSASRGEVDPFSRFMLSRDLRKEQAPAVTVTPFKGDAVGNGVIVRKQWDCRTGHERLIALLVFNPVGGRPWLASEVVRLSPAGGEGGRWTVAMEGPLAPGALGTVVVVVPEEEATAPVHVEVREKDGARSLLVEEWR